MEEYRVEIKVKNNLIYSRIMSLGYQSLSQFCQKNPSVCYGQLIDLINMKDSPLTAMGEFRPFIYKLCDALECVPEVLFTQNQIDLELKTNKFTKNVSEAELKFMLTHEKESVNPLKMIEDQQKNSAILELMEYLTPREQKVIKMRFGIDGDEMTLKQVGEVLGVCSQNVRMIEQKALRKMRHPSRRGNLKDYDL